MEITQMLIIKREYQPQNTST